MTALIGRHLLTRSQAERFQELESLMHSPHGESEGELLNRFHRSNDDYLPLLEQVLRGLVRLGEPWAQEKMNHFLEERGFQGPAVFLTPWEMTLTQLDEEVGRLDEVAVFYD
jgi:hypothetical protein